MAIETGKRKWPVVDGDSSESSLPADIIAHITGRLTSQVDFLNCRNVCPSWERALRGEARRLTATEDHVPWLLLAVKADESYLGRQTGTPQSPGGDVAAVQLPGRHVRLGRREICLGCSSGWLVMAHDFGYARVVNPLTGATAPLPPLWRLPYLDAAHSYDGCVGSFLYQDERHRGGPGVAFSFDGLCDLVLRKAVIVDIRDGGATVAILYRREREFAMARTGQRSWCFVNNKMDAIVDMARHGDGKLYTVHFSGKVARWKFDCNVHNSPEILESVMVIDSPYHYVIKDDDDNAIMSREYEHDHRDRAGECCYLVGAPGGTLYLLKRVYKHEQVSGGGRTQRTTATFDVWHLTWGSHDGMKWLTTMDGAIYQNLATFVSYTGAVCVGKRDAGGGENVLAGGAVYFTEEAADYVGAAMVEDFGVRMISIKRQRSKRIARMARVDDEAMKRMKEELEDEKSEEVKQLGRCMNWPPPFWFIPSLDESLGAAPPGK
uniref:KIB1-4 beta-propeller domain-containing protein n=1 Tax=Oryza punctata TaxID=4537 RepID=A0A0E0LIU7_ORYPU